jgi:hypothetical protein
MRPILSSLLTISALLASVPASATLLQSVSLSQTQVMGGTSVTGTITLDRRAPALGVRVSFSCNTSAASVVPAQVTVISGATTASFTVNTIPVTAIPGPPDWGIVTTITATPPPDFGSPKTAALTVLTPLLSDFTLRGPVGRSLAGGQEAEGQVVLNGPAPAGGIVISLANKNPWVVNLPGTVTIPAGAHYVNFTFTPRPVSAPTAVIISATRSDLNFKTKTVWVKPPGLDLIECGGAGLSRGQIAHCGVLLDVKANASIQISLSSSDQSLATVDPRSVTVNTGDVSAQFLLAVSQNASIPAGGTQVTITAQTGYYGSASITIPVKP